MHHRTWISFLTALFVCTVLVLSEQWGSPTTFAKPKAQPPALPLTCPSAEICANGYVYFEGAPVVTATVKFEDIYGTLIVTTTTGGLSASPYYQASLSSAPLLASVGDVVTVTASYNGITSSLTYPIVAGGQQVDIVIIGSSLFGIGQDGDQTISVNTNLNPRRASVTGVAGSSTLTLTNVNGGGFIVKELVLVHQSRGSGAGAWELGRVKSVGANTLTLEDPLNNSYVTDGGASRAQVIGVPEYHDLTIGASATVSPSSWDGNTGGILAFRANGTVTISGTIDATARGYQGGAGSACGSAWTGEGFNGGTVQGQNSTGHNGGGSGSGTGGGGGGNGTAGGNPSPLFGGAQGGTVGGSTDLSQMVFGGGGGGGEDCLGGGTGGGGGGAIVLMGKIITVSGTISSLGSDGQSEGASTAKGGGGGGGGSILIKGYKVSVGSNLVNANGGAGGTGWATGGAGGQGRIRIEYGSVSGTTTPLASLQELSFPVNPIPTFNTIFPTVSGRLLTPITFRALGASPDLGGATILSYVWRSDIVGVLGTTATLTRTANTLTAGTHNIFLKAKDSNGIFSEEVSRQLVIFPVQLYLPFVKR